MRTLNQLTATAVRSLLSVLPLAICIGIASASPVTFQPGVQGCISHNTGDPGTGTLQTVSLAEKDGVAGVKGFGDCSVTTADASDSLDALFIGGGDNSVVFPGAGLPVSWNFSATSTSGGNLNWRLLLNINGNEQELANGTTPQGSTVQGLATYSGLTGLTLSDWTMTLQLSNPAGADTISLSIPVSSLDINPLETPEPASMLLTAAGAALALFVRRRV